MAANGIDMMRWIALCTAMALAACSPGESTASSGSATQADPVATTHPESGLTVVPLTVTTAAGTVHRFDVEIAASAQEQAQGLMFRDRLGPGEGMIFPRDPPDVAGFWMKNTPLPLDIIFVGVDGRIMNIAARTTPYSLDTVTADGLTATVLEIPGGRAAELGIAAGDAVAWSQPTASN